MAKEASTFPVAAAVGYQPVAAVSRRVRHGAYGHLYSLGDGQLYNHDHDDPAAPEAVKYFKGCIRAADALLIAMPEYNSSITSVLKNAIDWASRPINDSPLSGKPLAIIGAGGTIRALLEALTAWTRRLRGE